MIGEGCPWITGRKSCNLNIKGIKQNVCAKSFTCIWQNNLIWEAYGLKSVYFAVKVKSAYTCASSLFFIMEFSQDGAHNLKILKRR
jgi:hypothetical protein